MVKNPLESSPIENSPIEHSAFDDLQARSSASRNISSSAPPMHAGAGFESGMKRDLCRLARFGANISDAHSCFIFLPEEYLEGQATALGRTASSAESYLGLAGLHSLSRELLPNCRLAVSTGLIGWVAKHRRSIHVSPFERDSRTLGIYTHDQQLKSFIGIPVALPMRGDVTQDATAMSGVIACDSRKAFAFSKLQGKLLEDLSLEVSNLLRLHARGAPVTRNAETWSHFLSETIKLVETIGRDSLEVLRIKLKNFEELEIELGTGECLKLVEQMHRLVKQSLPPGCPLLTLANGDLLASLDTMTSSFYENRISAACSRVCVGRAQPQFLYSRRSMRDRRYKSSTLERLIADTAVLESSQLKQGELYEFRRA
ncbi:MAG: hypothetical protein K1X83_05370 [Oligoflexia bacterium]|nr:hypothetical protein [Oligoflexia bacterium]